ncbi:MAG: helix-turn-helix domain-containing protein [Pseudomonadota bacterium]
MSKFYVRSPLTYARKGDGAGALYKARTAASDRAGTSCQEDWLTDAQAADLARVSLQTIKTARASGALRFHDVYGVMRIDPAQVIAWARGKRLIA